MPPSFIGEARERGGSALIPIVMQEIILWAWVTKATVTTRFFSQVRVNATTLVYLPSDWVRHNVLNGNKLQSYAAITVGLTIKRSKTH